MLIETFTMFVVPMLCYWRQGRVVNKYERWKDLVFRQGPEKLREFPGFHDEKLQGGRNGQRSSRLSLQYRVVYSVEKESVTVNINAHKY